MKIFKAIIVAVLLAGSMAVQAEAGDYHWRHCRPVVRCKDVVTYRCWHGRCREVVRRVCSEREWCGHHHRRDYYRYHD